jgi:hypothetical protein
MSGSRMNRDAIVRVEISDLPRVKELIARFQAALLESDTELERLSAGVQALRDKHQRVDGGRYASPGKPICWTCSLNDELALYVERWPCPDIRELDELFGSPSVPSSEGEQE